MMKPYAFAALVATGLAAMFVGAIVLLSKIIEALVPWFSGIGHNFDMRYPYVWIPLVLLLLVGGFGLAAVGWIFYPVNKVENNE